jgi:hypothetical protein
MVEKGEMVLMMLTTGTMLDRRELRSSN